MTLLSGNPDGSGFSCCFKPFNRKRQQTLYLLPSTSVNISTPLAKQVYLPTAVPDSNDRYRQAYAANLALPFIGDIDLPDLR